MLSISKNLILGYVLLVLTACSTKHAPPLDMVDRGRSMVFGNIQAPDMIEEIEFRQYGKFYIKGIRNPPKVLVYPNGNFMAENIKPGKYMLVRFISDSHDYTLVDSHKTAYRNIIHVKPGEIKYIGSYLVSNVKGRPLVKKDFDIDEVRRPGERTILKDLYEITEGTAWQQLIDRRLKQLRQ